MNNLSTVIHKANYLSCKGFSEWLIKDGVLLCPYTGDDLSDYDKEELDEYIEDVNFESSLF